ncbi:hypothetical protein [Clostridium estertheticum]|uniref:hypothetical protein n=1 Tax=Clostridium estertheticum TaxID=238834 RepID=UPI001C7CE8E3|nr:hypothetical protein [Clostridium estertheticum]MBX4270319.1 hypothetical protein [Clostridium estertheticum]WLC80860.1 hypothetical protein KTC98_06380 [Clostridium estertheticum]
MENVQKPKVGAGIKTMSIIQLVFSGFGLIGFIMIILMKDTIKTAGGPAITTSYLIISLVLLIITTIGIILILMKKELGIYIYFIAEVASIVYSIVINGFKPLDILSLIIPALMGIFIWKKKEIFSTETKNIEV